MRAERRLLYTVLSVGILLGAWQLLSVLINTDFIIPGIPATAMALGRLLVTADFWLAVLHSLGRILLGFLLGVLIGCLLVPLTHKFGFFYTFVSLIMTVIKSTPVASFILVLWCIIGSESVPMAIAILMVTPLVWQNLSEAYGALDRELCEVAEVFMLPPRKRFLYVMLPTFVRFLIPALISAVGLAWKAGIAAEIIAYTADSIGRQIISSKNFFEGPQMYAWTLTVLALSLLFEKVITTLGRKAVKAWHLS